jgi:hypothetical protein
MKPAFHLWLLKPKSSQSSGFRYIHQTSQNSSYKCLTAKKLMATVFWDMKGMLMVKFMQHGTTITPEVYCGTLKKLCRAVENKRHEMLVCSSMTMRIHIQLLALEHCWSISAGSCLTTLLTALISLQVTTTCLPTWRTGCACNASTIIRSWWKVSKHSWAHKWQASLTEAYKNILQYDKCLNFNGNYVEK